MLFLGHSGQEFCLGGMCSYLNPPVLFSGEGSMWFFFILSHGFGKGFANLTLPPKNCYHVGLGVL